MTLLIITVVLFAAFWGGSMIAQAYLYNAPVDHLPYRALGAALVVSGFLTFWVWLDSKNPGRYSTFFEFSPYTMKEFDEFEAVRWRAVPGSLNKGKAEILKGPDGKVAETVVKVRRMAGNKTAPFVDDTGKPFHLQEGGTMTAALIVKVTDAANPVRFNADMKQDPRIGPIYATDEKRFTEASGSRYISGVQLGVLYIPSTGAIFLALFVNFMLFVVWLAAFWPILRFTFGHSLVLMMAFGFTTMLLIMPLLFKPNRAVAGVEKPAPFATRKVHETPETVPPRVKPV